MLNYICIGAAAACLFLRPAAAAGLLLLELFTSQGCYSCPPAERLFAQKYADRPGLLALEMHVDYWDDLVYGHAGSWQDPFSDPVFTRRQRLYASSLGQNVYTPQAVVQGASGMNGSAGSLIDSRLEQLAAGDFTFGWEVEFAAPIPAGPGWQVRIAAGQGAAEAYLVVFRNRAVTKVGAGENKGKELVNRNIVVEFEALGQIGAESTFAVGAPPPEHGCALILQRPGQGAALGAWRCPDA